MCLNANNGTKVWSVNFVKDFGGSVPHWGYSESPLVEQENLIVTPGGRDATVVALDNFLTGARRNIDHLSGHPRFEFREQDITRPFAVEGVVESVVNMASPASPKFTL